MKKFYKRILSLICAGFIFSGAAASLYAYADEPYDVYNYDRWGDPIPSQAGYIADRAVSGDDLGIGHFSEPQDIFRDHNDIFYIADTGNNRIAAVNSDLDSIVRVYDAFTMPDGTQTSLKSPKGIFVSEYTGLMYIADCDNSRVLVSDLDGNVVREITKPDSEVYDQSKTFLPQKVIADKAGNVYTVLGNITTGAAMFDPDGSFIGFYGANRVEATSEIIGNYFTRFFTPEAKKARRKRNIPSGITNFDIEGDFVFTCTSSTAQSADTVKKLNAAGNNIFADLSLTFGDFTPMYDTNTNTSYEPKICDIDISDDGGINCLDFTTGRVFQYDEDCNLLFITGTISKQQLGGFDQVAAIETMDERLYVLDQQKCSVTVFKETSFGRIVHKATNLYNDGFYEDALEPWYEVLRRDGNYRRAYIGVASALLNSGDYEGAMKYAKLADAPAIYNKAFEGYRMDFLNAHFTEIIFGLIVLAAALAALSRHMKKKRLALEAAEAAEREKRRISAGEEE